MTSPQSPPKRRRRRIVVTIALLVLGMTWWVWPRVDQRFVGTWKIGSSGRSYLRTSDVLELRKDGSGELLRAGPGQSRSVEWQASFGSLSLFAGRRPEAIGMFQRDMDHAWSFVTGAKNVSDSDRWMVESVSPTEMNLIAPGHNHRVSLTRLSE